MLFFCILYISQLSYTEYITDFNDYSSGHFGNIITATITPMCGGNNHQSDALDVQIDYYETAKIAVHLIKNGSDALVISGTTGEAPTTHLDEKGKLLKSVRSTLIAAFPDRHIPLIAGVGSNDTQHVISNIKVAEQSSADALLVVSPYYSRPSTKGLISHYKVILESTQLPIIIYDVPARSGVEITLDVYKELAKYPNFVAIKDATGNVLNAKMKYDSINSIRTELKLPKIALYCGDDSKFFDFLEIGANGIISVASHIVGNEFKSAFETYNDNNNFSDGVLNKINAKNILDSVMPQIELLNGKGQQASSTKLALKLMGIIKSDQMRLPNIAISDSDLMQFKIDYKNIFSNNKE